MGPWGWPAPSVTSDVALLGQEGLRQDPHFPTCRKGQLTSTVRAGGHGLEMLCRTRSCWSPLVILWGGGAHSPSHHIWEQWWVQVIPTPGC